MFGSFLRAVEDAVDSGIGLISQVPGLADAAETAREALVPFRSPLVENGWPKGHRVLEEKFVVERLLGVGGFACVYAVRDPRTDDLFALKRVVAPSRECLERARREVAVASGASGSPAVGLLPLVASSEAEIDKSATEVLMLFPFCAGGSLADAKQRQRERRERQRSTEDDEDEDGFLLSLPLLLSMFADVAEGLSTLHSGGFGHFDVKPHNVFLRRRSSPSPYGALLGDFGSAKAIPLRFKASSSGSDPSRSYLSVAEDAERETTAAYRPPELHDPLSFATVVARSSSSGPPSTSSKPSNERIVDGKADVWSLGATLFAVLCDGRSPPEVVGGGGGSLSLAACSGKIQWTSSLPVPSAVKALVERCLSTDPGERPTAGELASELRRLAGG